MKIKILAASTHYDKSKVVEVEHLEDVEQYIDNEEFIKDLINEDISWERDGEKRDYVVTRDKMYLEDGEDYVVVIYDYFLE